MGRKDKHNYFNKGLGVFAARVIPEGIYFGPYMGYIINTTFDHGNYAWAVRATDDRYQIFKLYISRYTTISASLCIISMDTIHEILTGYDT